MISTALLFDAAIGNVQEKAMREHKASNVEVVQYSYGIGFVYLLVALIVTGNLVSGLRFCATVSSSKRRKIFWFLLPNENWIHYFRFHSIVSHTNIRLCIPVQFIRLSRHSICADIGADMRCTISGHCNNGSKGGHHRHFVHILRQTVQHSVNIFQIVIACLRLFYF